MRNEDAKGGGGEGGGMEREKQREQEEGFKLRAIKKRHLAKE